ncbi:ATP-binding protein [Terrimonas sp. NA20]|uniref:histidine kinase n=1 Tax=Terrimonas ginsenosidimutans TaxID=2908004 RepID=A0ABS9KLT9_9BACT|nr:ATP-binding protein [Terrimonas ginsenosidimutans]MCG2613287.1 ATP-binding protein [Terrimonas ginsenosidimutans]
MNPEKEILLNEALDRVCAIGWGLEPDDLLQNYFAEHLMIVGTTADELFFDLDGLRTLIRRQKDQSAGLELHFSRTPVYRNYCADDNVAVFVEHVAVKIKTGTETIILGIRSSAVMEYISGKWKLVHWHASKPEMVQSDSDTFGIDDWKKKTDALEKLVAERTADLVIKNRELEIETSLEKVRSRTMAMHHSSELKEIIRVLYQQLIYIGMPVEHAGFIIDYKSGDTMKLWIADHYKIPSKITIPYFDSPHWNSFLTARETGANFFANHLDFDEKNRFYTKLFTFFPELPAEANEYYFTCPGLAISTVLLENIGVYIENFSGIPYTDEENATLMRFGNVFQQAYTRFLDLGKAEAQAREARIENALEKVRSRTMGMQHSNELADASFVLDSQVRALGIETWGCAFNIYGENDSTEWFSSERGTLPAYKTPRENLFLRYYEAGQTGAPIHVETFKGEECITHYEYLCTIPVMGDALRGMLAAGGSFPTQQTDHAIYFKYGYLLFITLDPAPESYDIFIRFAKVFEQTYTRFLDLQKAEAQTRESQIQLALERVRARTMAMQNSNELIEAANVMFQQVAILTGDVSWNYGFNIWDDDKQWATSWNGTKIGIAEAFRTPSNQDVYKRIYDALQKGETLYIEEIGGQELTEHYQYIDSLPIAGQILRDFQKAGIALPSYQIFHVAFFTQGYLMFITYEQVPALHDIFKRFAVVFEQTYTRFLDLQKAEAQALKAQQDVTEIKQARQKAENALYDLQAAQKQLIQSEKMASLGELTAGIAHEIQNPLNFVNNFSDVSKELIDEMKTELANGNTTIAIEIADDLIQNLEKIHHHGKRADSIVKGMLQHSQSSKGQKTPTDINTLADEYLRLAYHGLRAKDKNFNATLQTDFDSTIGNINVISQDIGRVLLNLITNALYVVEEKRKSGIGNYNPTVSISTRKTNNTVEIEVSDNGNGIPKAIIDKIFQPFFTTKPTGQGTGLGLSLSYDIVKAHGGELKVKTEEGNRSTFIIQIPVS